MPLSLGLGVALVVAYAIVALIGVPLAIERALAGLERSAPNRQARVERIRVNPFTLTVDLFDLEASDPATQISLAHVRCSLDVASVLERRWVLDELVIERPQLRLDRGAADALANTYAVPIAAAREALSTLRLRRLVLTEGRLELVAAPESRAGTLVLERIAVTSGGIDAALNRGGYSGTVGRAFGGTLSYEGELALGDLTAHGRLAGTGIDLAALGTWLEPELATPPPVGTVDLSGEYELSPHPRIDLAGRLEPGGATLAVGRDWEAGRDALELRLDDVPAAMLSPYARVVLGRGLAAGSVDLALEYAHTGERGGAGELDIRAIDLAFERAGAAEASLETAPPPTSDDLAALPLGLAAALLEDPNAEIGLAVPFAPEPGAWEAEGRAALLAAAARALRVRILTLAGNPFHALAAVVGRDGSSWHGIAFEPGTAALSATALDSLAPLAAALKQRPMVGLAVRAGYDPEADRDALALQQIELHVLLATAGAAPQARPAPLDLASPRVQDVLDEFAGERLGSVRLAALAARFERDASAPSDSPARVAYYRAIFDALVANEEIEAPALERLGRYRAQAVVGMLATNGIGADRVSVSRDDLVLGAEDAAVEASLALVPLGRFAPSGAAALNGGTVSAD